MERATVLGILLEEKRTIILTKDCLMKAYNRSSQIVPSALEIQSSFQSLETTLQTRNKWPLLFLKDIYLKK
jgi:hypothetical protein